MLEHTIKESETLPTNYYVSMTSLTEIPTRYHSDECFSNIYSKFLIIIKLREEGE